MKLKRRGSRDEAQEKRMKIAQENNLAPKNGVKRVLSSDQN